MIYVFKFLLAISLLWPSLALGMTYVGGSWVDDTAYVYNGTSWVEATKWHYTGSAWQEIEAGAPPEDQTLTINPVPVNGRVVEPGDGTNINCGTGGDDCEQVYPFNTNVTLTAIADSGYQLDSWIGVDVDNGDGTANVTMDSTKEVSATFVEESTDSGFVGIKEPLDSENTGTIIISSTSEYGYNTRAEQALASGPVSYVHFAADVDMSDFNCNVGIYDSSGSLLVDGSLGVAISNGNGWYTVQLDSSINISDSESYIIAFGSDNAPRSIYFYRSTVGYSDAAQRSVSGSVTDDMPSTLSTGTAVNYNVFIIYADNYEGIQ